jgi:hypothetical protein
VVPVPPSPIADYESPRNRRISPSGRHRTGSRNVCHHTGGRDLDAGVILMRFFAGLLAYLVGVSAVISIGIVGLMALQPPIERTSSAPSVAVERIKSV